MPSVGNFEFFLRQIIKDKHGNIDIPESDNGDRDFTHVVVEV